MLENIKGIIFDVDNTIIDHKKCEEQTLQYLFDKIGISYKNKYQDIFRPLDYKLWDDVVNNKSKIPVEKIPEYRFEIFFRKIDIEYYNYKRANELFMEGFKKTSALTKNAFEIVKYLYDKGYKIYIITNGLVELQMPRIMNSKIAPYISNIIVSEEVGISKPNRKIFDTLLERVNLNQNEVVMIGDSIEKDIMGAKNAHIKNIWYNP